MSERALVLIVVPPAGAGAAIDRVAQAVHAAGGEPWPLPPDGMPDDAPTRRPPREPAVALVGPDVPQPLSLARRLHRAWPSAPLLFVAHPDDEASLRRRLSYGAPAGSQWTVLRDDDAQLVASLAETIRAARQARQLRTTLDRMNLRLASPPALDTNAYRRLVVSDRYLAAILIHAHDAIVSLDRRGIVQTWNLGAERMLGIGAHEAIGHPLAALAPWPPDVPAALQQAGDGAALRHEWLLDLPDRALYVEAVLSPVHDEAGHPIGIAAIMRDVSAVRQLVESLREADRRKDEFLAMLAHELRNPLAPVVNGIRLLDRKEDLTESGRRTLGMIDRQVRQMKRLVDDLLEVSRITRGTIELRPEPMLLGSAIVNAVETVLPACDAKGQTLSTRLPERPVRLVADPVRVLQVLENLLSNASKYTPEGGTIRVEASESPDAVEFRVIDDGIGIEPDKLESVFELFVQVQPGVGEHQGGLGIGLAMVRRLVQMHGGTVSAWSEGLGRGTTFTVRLPRRIDAEPVGAQAIETR